MSMTQGQRDFKKELPKKPEDMKSDYGQGIVIGYNVARIDTLAFIPSIEKRAALEGQLEVLGELDACDGENYVFIRDRILKQLEAFK